MNRLYRGQRAHRSANLRVTGKEFEADMSILSRLEGRFYAILGSLELHAFVLSQRLYFRSQIRTSASSASCCRTQYTFEPLDSHSSDAFLVWMGTIGD